MVLEKFRNIISKENIPFMPKSQRPIRHVALTMHGLEFHAKLKNLKVKDVYKKSFETVTEIIKQQPGLNIPIITFYILSDDPKKEEFEDDFNEQLSFFLYSLSDSDIVHKNKIKISVLGKWYDLTGRIVEPIKRLIEETKDYDNFFINFCINYNGQEEIVDGCKLIARQIKAGKLEVDSINKNTIKENIYSSYFLPPDIIIKTGRLRRTSGLLLWDSVYSEIYFIKKDWPEIEVKDISNSISEFKKES